jgi:hypothetical protein
LNTNSLTSEQLELLKSKLEQFIGRRFYCLIDCESRDVGWFMKVEMVVGADTACVYTNIYQIKLDENLSLVSADRLRGNWHWYTFACNVFGELGRRSI